MFNQSKGKSTKQNLIDIDIPHLWKSYPHCCFCKREFSNYDKALPMVLHCLHNICEKCTFERRHSKAIKCFECKKITPIANHQLVRECIEPNFYLIGFLQYREFIAKSDIYYKSRVSSTLTESNYICNECNEKTSKFCEDCKVPLCKNCFGIIHFSKTLKNHKFKEFEIQQFSSQSNLILIDKNPKRCQQHGRVMEFYCHDCNSLICTSCISGKIHQGHKTTTIQKENRNVIPKLQQILSQINMTREKVNEALKTSKFIENTYLEYGNDIFDDIFDYFTKLHSKLQYIEKVLHNRVKAKLQEPIKTARFAYSSFMKTHETLNNLEDQIKELMNDSTRFTVLDGAAHAAKSILQGLACSVEFDGFDQKPFKFQGHIEKFNENVLECYQLDEIDIGCNLKISLQSGESINYDQQQNLTSFEYLNNIYQTTSMKQSNNQTLLKPFSSLHERSKSNSIKSNTFYGNKNKYETIGNIFKNDEKLENTMNSSFAFNSIPQISSRPISLYSDGGSAIAHSSIPQSFLSDTSSHAMSSFSRNIDVCQIKVIYAQNPHNFYVRTDELSRAYALFARKLKESSQHATEFENIISGQLCLLYNVKEHSWMRVQVIQQSNRKLNNYVVKAIDFGYTMGVPKSRLLSLSEELKNAPPHVVRCSTYAVEPTDKAWIDDAIYLMVDICNTEGVKMIICDKSDDELLVDLIILRSNYPVSLRDSLISANFAVSVAADEHKLSEIAIMKRKLLNLSSSPVLHKTSYDGFEQFQVKILNIINPHSFYVIRYDEENILQKLEEELNQQKLEKLCCPEIDMICCVKVREKLYRARIVKGLGNGQYTVWLCDKGIYETVKWKQLWILNEEFMNHNEYAIHCSLADVEPSNDSLFWSDEAINEFKKLTKHQNFKIEINSVRDFCHKVILFIVQKESNININALLVNKKYAICAGGASVNVESRNDISIIEYFKSCSFSQNKSNASTKSMLPPSSSSSQKANNRIDIKLIRIVSPGEFYIYFKNNLLNKIEFQEMLQIKQNLKLKKTRSISFTQKMNWKLNDYCLVRLELEEGVGQQWYRGKILGINIIEADNNKTSFNIYLRDYGITVSNISSKKLDTIDMNDSEVNDTIIKCHMACVKPTGNLDKWTNTAIDEMQNIPDKYESFAVTVCEKYIDNSLPVILWGLKTKTKDAFSPIYTKWININKLFVDIGYAHLTEKFDVILNKNLEKIEQEIQNEQIFISTWLQNFEKDQTKREIKNVYEVTETNNYLFEILQNESQSNFSKIGDWLKDNTFNKSTFTGYPTYVDNDGLIYIHDFETKQILDKMKEVINEKVDQLPPSNVNVKWRQGQPCLAKYHLDNLFYRATILKINSNEKTAYVKFVDYGNEEFCSFNDLKHQIMFGKIPILTKRYKLADVVPYNKQTNMKKWTIESLNFIHAQIVLKLCTIRVLTEQNENDIEACSICFDNFDLAELLIDNNYAVRISKPFQPTDIEENPMQFADYQHNVTNKDLFLPQIENSFSSKYNTADDDTLTNEENESYQINENNEIKPNDKKMDYHDWEKFFEKKEMVDLYKMVKQENNNKEIDDDDDDDDDHDDDVNINVTHGKLNYQYTCDPYDDYDKNSMECKSNCSTIGEYSAFYPKGYSTEKSQESDTDSTADILNYEEIIKKYREPKIDQTVSNFYCNVTLIENSTTFYIIPYICKLQYDFQMMSQSIQMEANQLQSLDNFSTHTPCIALYSADNTWYRAVIQKYYADTKKCRVLYVDYLNSEMVPITRIKKCPKRYKNIPLNCIRVKLNNIKRNPRYHEPDVQRELEKFVKDRKIFAKIIEQSFKDDGTNKIIKVELYESEKQENLVYENLINQKFLLKVK